MCRHPICRWSVPSMSGLDLSGEAGHREIPGDSADRMPQTGAAANQEFAQSCRESASMGKDQPEDTMHLANRQNCSPGGVSSLLGPMEAAPVFLDWDRHLPATFPKNPSCPPA